MSDSTKQVLRVIIGVPLILVLVPIVLLRNVLTAIAEAIEKSIHEAYEVLGID